MVKSERGKASANEKRHKNKICIETKYEIFFKERNKHHYIINKQQVFKIPNKNSISIQPNPVETKPN